MWGLVMNYHLAWSSGRKPARPDGGRAKKMFVVLFRYASRAEEGEKKGEQGSRPSKDRTRRYEIARA